MAYPVSEQPLPFQVLTLTWEGLSGLTAVAFVTHTDGELCAIEAGSTT
jgi:hypothetical protein